MIRRSYISASAPAGTAQSMSGNISAVCTSATMLGLPVSCVMSHAAPTPSTSIPKLVNRLAVQIRRYIEIFKGLRTPADFCGGSGDSMQSPPRETWVVIAFPQRRLVGLASCAAPSGVSLDREWDLLVLGISGRRRSSIAFCHGLVHLVSVSGCLTQFFRSAVGPSEYDLAASLPRPPSHSGGSRGLWLGQEDCWELCCRATQRAGPGE
jgi:hypothetical protein